MGKMQVQSKSNAGWLGLSMKIATTKTTENEYTGTNTKSRGNIISSIAFAG